MYSNMTSFKRFGSKPVVKYAYIGISDRQRHNLFWLFKYRICPIRIEIIHGELNIYGFYHGLALYADILPLAIARGKIFGIKGKPVVNSIYIQAPMNYSLNIYLLTTRGKVRLTQCPHERSPGTSQSTGMVLILPNIRVFEISR